MTRREQSNATIHHINSVPLEFTSYHIKRRVQSAGLVWSPCTINVHMYIICIYKLQDCPQDDRDRLYTFATVYVQSQALMLPYVHVCIILKAG